MTTVTNTSQQLQPEAAPQAQPSHTDRFWHNGKYQPELDPLSFAGDLRCKKQKIADLSYEDKVRILRGLYEKDLSSKRQPAPQESTQAKPATTKANKQSKARNRRGNKAQLPSVEQVAAHLKRCKVRGLELQCCVWLYRLLSKHYSTTQQGKVINRVNMAKANGVAIPKDNSAPRTVERAFKTMKELGIIRADQPRINSRNSTSVTNLSSEIIGGSVPSPKPKPKQPRAAKKTASRPVSFSPNETGRNSTSDPSHLPSDPSHSFISESANKSNETGRFKTPPTEGFTGAGSTASAPLRATAVSASQKASKSSSRIPAPEELNFVDGEAVPDGSLQPGDRLSFLNEVLTFVEYRSSSDDCVLIRDSDDSVVVYSPLTLRLSAAKL